MAIIYEWDFETMNEHGDIIDHDFNEKLSQYNKGNSDTEGLVLVREEQKKNGGLLGAKMWAYVEKDKLPTTFTDAMGLDTGIKVPIRFHKELRTYTQTYWFEVTNKSSLTTFTVSVFGYNMSDALKNCKKRFKETSYKNHAIL